MEMRSGQGFSLVHPIMLEESFQLVNDFHKEILRMKDKDNFPVVLVSTKLPLILVSKIRGKLGKKVPTSSFCC
jgi:hypothetical protein